MAGGMGGVGSADDPTCGGGHRCDMVHLGGGASARREAWRTICPRFEDDLAQSVDDADSEVREVRPSDARDHRLLGHPG
jgi:hypothetical protein